MIRNLLFFENGNYAAFDEHGQQVPPEQGCAWHDVVRDKLKRGVIDDTTTIDVHGQLSTTVKDWKGTFSND